MRFKDKIVLVTGGNSGIGLATAKRVAEEGGKVIITGRDRNSLDAAVEAIGADAVGVVADVTNIGDLDRLYAGIREKYGRLDGLFANAGIATFQPIETVTEATYDSLMNTNVKGVFFTIQKAIPLLAAGSSVVVNASVAQETGSPMTAVYAAGKAAVRSMARTFSGELLGRGIRVNAVSPGPVETPIWQRTGGLPKEAAAGMVARIKESNPMKRYGKPEEVAGAVAFLLSSESSYMAGSTIYVDGGATQL